MHGLDDMYLFKNVVSYGGISTAARRLAISKSTLARRISELEDRLGGLLFHRNSRSFQLTAFGKECYASCVSLAAEADKVLALAERFRQKPSGFLQVICPPMLGSMLVDSLAIEFAAAEPEVRLHLEETTGIFDPRLSQADFTIYPAFKPLPDSSLVARKIFTSPYVLAARPNILDHVKDLSRPFDLKALPCLGLGSRDAEWAWQLQRGREKVTHRFEPVFTTTLPSALHQAARRGLGVASLPELFCRGDLVAGELVAVLPEWKPQPVNFYAIYPGSGTLSVAARRFLDLLLERLPAIAAEMPTSLQSP